MPREIKILHSDDFETMVHLDININCFFLKARYYATVVNRES